MGYIGQDNFDSHKGNDSENKPSPPLPPKPQQAQAQSPSPQSVSYKRPREPIKSTELSVRIAGALDTRGNIEKARLDEIFFFLEEQLDKIKETLIYFAEDAGNKLLGEDPSERLNEAIQSFNRLREIMTRQKELYNPYFNSNLDPRKEYKYASVKNNPERKVSAIYGDVINSFFMVNGRQDGTVVPKFLKAWANEKYIVPIEVVFDAVDMYFNNIKESGIVSWDKEKLYWPFIEAFEIRLNSISDDEFKKLNTKNLTNMLGWIEQLAVGIDKPKLTERTENFIFGLALKCLKSEIMDKRVFGLGSIMNCVGSLESNHDQKSPIADRIYGEAFPVIFGKNSHINLIKGSDKIIKFVFNDPFSSDEKRDALFYIIWQSIIVNILKPFIIYDEFIFYIDTIWTYSGIFDRIL